MAIDPAANKIYWANYSQRHDPGREPGRLGHRLDPVRQREQARAGWRSTPRRTRSTGPTRVGTTGVRVGNLDGSGTASTLFGSEANPIGVAIDPAAGKIYWADLGSCCSGPGTIRVGNLDGSGTASTLFGSEAGPAGVAIDPAANKIYWGNFGTGAIRVGNLDGTGTAADLFTRAGLRELPRAAAGAERHRASDHLR